MAFRYFTSHHLQEHSNYFFLLYIYMLIIFYFYLFVFHNASYQKHIVNHSYQNVPVNNFDQFCVWPCFVIEYAHLCFLSRLCLPFFDLTLIINGINGCFVPLSFCPFLSASCRVLCYFFVPAIKCDDGIVCVAAFVF